MLLDFQNRTIDSILADLESEGNRSDYLNDAILFLRKWKQNDELFSIYTSGTTGPIKQIDFTRESLIRSAQITLDTFSLIEGDDILNSLPFSFVAGKMMLVRAIVGKMKLHLLEPSANPVPSLNKKIRFAAFTPFQLQHIIEQNPNKLDLIDSALIGGSKVEMNLEKRLQGFKTVFFESFGMSETLTHIAVRILNGEDRSTHFSVLEGFNIGAAEDQCLIISASHLPNSPIVTNDIIELIDEKHFLWLGRKDNVINSGGIKVFPETIEKKLNGRIDQSFMITKLPDEKLGEKVVLVVESEVELKLSDIDFSSLSKYEKPKELRLVNKLPRNENGKVLRKINS